MSAEFINQNEKPNPSTGSGQKYRVWWDEENKVVRNELIGEMDEEIAKGVLEEVAAESERHGRAVVLVDTSKHTKITADARIIMSKLLKRLPKVAFFGSSVSSKWTPRGPAL